MTKPQQTADQIFAGEGEMAQLMRSYDWSQTALGTPEKWPQSLKTAVRIVLTSRQPMFVWWGEDLINLYNDPYKAIVGGKHPAALGQPASVVWREIWDQIGPRAESAILKNEGTYDEALLLIMERNGYPEETYYTFSYSPTPNDQGEAGGILCANTDDTQRIISERQLTLLRDLAAKTADARTFQEACRLSASCLETNPYDLPFAMIYLVDPDQRHFSLEGTAGIDRQHAAVPETVNLTGSVWSLATVLKTHQACLISNLDASFGNLPTGAWPQAPHQAIAVPLTASGQTGRAGILVVGLNPFRLLDDRYRGFIDLVAAQISASIAHAQAYEEERKRAESLAELDRAKTAFFSNVSHEFRTPLTLMLSPLEELSRTLDERLQPQERQQLQLVQRNGLRLQKLVNLLLDFSRIEAGRMRAIFEPTDLATYTAELASIFRSLIEQAGMQLVIDCPPLPEPVYIDFDMWEKIVLNLLSNAFKFTFAGKITIQLQAVGETVELSVSDTGVGIPEAELPRLFERFHRVSGTRSRTYEGSGIGLALVQELVKLHGGQIQVASQLEQGTTFTIVLPFGSKHIPSDHLQQGSAKRFEITRTLANPYVEEALRWLPEGRDAKAGENEDAPLDFSPAALFISCNPAAHVLLVDDNADMRDYVKRLLSQYWDVETASDGLKALKAIAQHPPDLVLTDVMMPGLDGFGLLRELRNNDRTREIPIILLSARAGEEAHIEGLEAGADDYLIKPFSARELLARVESNLKLFRLRQEAAQQEQALRMEVQAIKESLENVLTRIADQFLALDRNWRYTYVNDRVTEVTGIPREKFLGRTIWELFPDTVGSQFETELHRAVAEQTPVQFESFYPPINRWFENHVYPSANGVSIFSTEITERKQAEAERQRLLEQEQAAREQAERANRIKDEFLSILSHELRSPLNPILGWAQLLQTRNFDATQTAQALATIERNARLQTQLIDDLLDVAKILRGKLSMQTAPLDLTFVIESAMDTVKAAAVAKNIHLHSVVSQTSQVLGDAARLQQVVWNLLSNAIKFTPQNGQVEIRLEAVDGQAKITVTDTGKGIKPEFLPHIFESFRQEDASTTRKYGGLGLGLAIVHYLVEAHGGTIWADSQGEGQGATFTLQLPVLDLQLPRNSEQELRQGFDLTGMRILVVDNEPDARELLAVLLTQYGAEVLAVASAAEALANLESFQPNILVSDIGMPEMNGFTLVEQLRTLPPEKGGKIPAIALTAYAREEDQQQAIASGYQCHITKPLEPEQLVRAMMELTQFGRGEHS